MGPSVVIYRHSPGGALIGDVRMRKITISRTGCGCLTALGWCVVLFLVLSWWGSEPRFYDDSLRGMILSADRIVVRDGGDICCTSAEETLKQRVLFEVRDPREVETVRDHMRFFPVMTRNRCLCCGQPGIDWYRGDERLAITAWKHGSGIMWGGGKNLAYLTWGSRDWLRRWLQKHRVPDDKME